MLIADPITLFGWYEICSQIVHRDYYWVENNFDHIFLFSQIGKQCKPVHVYKFASRINKIPRCFQDLEQVKKLLFFVEYTKGAQLEVLVALIQSIVERIYMVDGERYCHIVIKGRTGGDHTNFFWTVRYIECIAMSVLWFRGVLHLQHVIFSVSSQRWNFSW